MGDFGNATKDRRGDWSWDYPDWSTRENPTKAYRGVTSEEWAYIQENRQILSTQAFSWEGEGTSFARDASTSLSYAQVGRDNPARTGKPIYVVEVNRVAGITGRRGYDYLVAHAPVPASEITRVWRFNSDGTSETLASPFAGLAPTARAGTALAGNFPPELYDRAHDLLTKSMAPNTRTAYAADWADWRRWTKRHRVPDLPSDKAPATLDAYAQNLALYAAAKSKELTVSSLQRRMAGIAQVIKAAGFDPPPTRSDVVRRVIRGVRKEKPPPQPWDTGATPLMIDQVRAIAARLDATQPLSIRAGAIMLLGFAAGLRASDLVALDIRDVRKSPDGKGIFLTVYGKTERGGEPAVVAVPRGREPTTDPVAWLDRWLNTVAASAKRRGAAVASGPVFRPFHKRGDLINRHLSPRAISDIVKQLVGVIGLDRDRYSAHSLRSGHVSSALAAGVARDRIRRTTRHKGDKMIDVYDKRRPGLDSGSAGDLGL